MGEIAEMMLDSTLCQVCGDYLGWGDGIPRYCRDCKPKKIKTQKQWTDEEIKKLISTRGYACYDYKKLFPFRTFQAIKHKCIKLNKKGLI